MKIGVVGNGVVGSAIARTYLEHVEEVCIWDDVWERRTHRFQDVMDCDLIFICLPEKVVEEFLAQQASVEEHPSGDHPFRDLNYVIKSTVPIGMTRRLREQYGLKNIVHSPEFLTARCAFTDAQTPTRNIIGSDRHGDNLDPRGCARVLHCLYATRFPGVPILSMTSDESEAVKLCLNSFFAVKVSFFNEIYHLCGAKGLDWETVRGGILSDGRIAHSHTQVPGHDGRTGYGGTCLPKDLQQLIDSMEEHQQYGYICRAAQDRNKEVDRKEAT